MAQDPIMFGTRLPRSETEAQREKTRSEFPISCFIRDAFGDQHQVVGYSEDGRHLQTHNYTANGREYAVPVDQAWRIPANLVVGLPEERARAAEAILLDEAAE